MKYLLMIPVIIRTSFSIACDVCGGSASSYNVGIVQNYNSHFIGFRYSHSGYRTTISHFNLPEQSHDTYLRAELAGRWSASEKIKVLFSVPYVLNSSVAAGNETRLNGPGDPVILVQYRLLAEESPAFNHYLFAGAGLKFPVGKFSTGDGTTSFSKSIQPGTGSFDFIVNLNYLYRKGRSGLQIETLYKLNSANRQDYRFGNQFNFSGNYVLFLTSKKITLLGFSGIFAETGSAHKQDKKRVTNTGGQVVFANAGLQFYWKVMRIGAGLKYPLLQNFRTDNLTDIFAKPQWSCDLIFFMP